MEICEKITTNRSVIQIRMNHKLNGKHKFKMIFCHANSAMANTYTGQNNIKKKKTRGSVLLSQ